MIYPLQHRCVQRRCFFYTIFNYVRPQRKAVFFARSDICRESSQPGGRAGVGGYAAQKVGYLIFQPVDSPTNHTRVHNIIVGQTKKQGNSRTLFFVL